MTPHFQHMNNFKKRAILFLTILWFSIGMNSAGAQTLDLQYNVNPTDLAQTITGNGVQILNPVLTCADSASGRYDITAVPGFPHGPGVILSTGNIKDANGPNFDETTTTEWGTPGDPLINLLSGQQSYDACKLEFDIIPVGDTLKFKFTFASEEYREYVGTPFNDAFGFFISGPGITGDPGFGADQNIALIPGSSQPVTINSVNDGNPSIGFPAVNPQFYYSNPAGQGGSLQYDGWTKGLYAQKVVTPCDTFHLKLVIADVADKKWDSSVFIEKIESNNVTLSSSTIAGIDNLIEGCNDGEVTFTRTPVTDQPLTVQYFIDGTAINGVDYDQIGSDPSPTSPKFITIPANQASATVSVTTVNDGINEGNETVIFYVGNPFCTGGIQDSLIFIIQDSLDVAIHPPLAYVCLGDSLKFEVESSGTDFSWSPAAGLSDPMSKEPTVIPAANEVYTLTASAGGCTSTATTEINVTDIQLSVSASQILCGGAADGSIDLTIAGGQTPIEVQWVGPSGFVSADEDLTSLAPGTYIALVTDRDGCNATISATISEISAMNISITSPVFPGGQNVSCFQSSDGQATANVAGGTPPYTFSWNDPSSQTSQTATNLPAGTYEVTVTDANGCESNQSITLSQPELITGNLVSRTNVLCNGLATGSATIEAQGGISPYTYSWNTIPPQSGTSASGLQAGFYTVTITDINGCTGTTEVEIEQPLNPIAGTVITSMVSCNGESDATAEAIISGGVAPYTYSWSDDPGITTAQRNNLSAGNYALTVTDANGCVFVIPFNITQPNPIQVTVVDQTNIACAGDHSGSITVSASGGTGNFSYSWDTNPVQTGNSVSGLDPGIYSVTVTDGNSCVGSLSVEITEPAPLDIEVVAESAPSCASTSDGSIEVAASGGSDPYAYQWNTVPLTNGALLSGIEAGSYQVTVTDANGCSKSLSVTLNAPSPIQLSAGQVQNVLCYGEATGSAEVNVSGGTPGYTYLWNDPSAQTSPVATGLAAGLYTVAVTDANGCSASYSIEITQPAAPLSVSLINVSDIACFGDSSGYATVSASGGSGNYAYQWNDSQNQQTPTASNLTAGTYTVTVTDNNGCTTPVSLDVTIGGPSAALVPELIPSSYIGGVNVVCADDSTASIDLQISGGTAPYSVLWDLPGIETSTDEDLTGLAPGIYTVAVTDASGCEASASITLTAPEPIAVVAETQPSLCFGSPTGSIDITVSGGIAPFSVAWTGPGGFTGSGESLTALAGGVYIATITDANGCVYTEAVTVTQPENLTITIDSLSDYNGFNTSCWNSYDGEIYITPSGGTEPYSYQWNAPGNPNFSNQQDLINLGGGNYEAVLFDANGCIENQMIVLTSPDTLSADFDLSLYPNGFNVSCNGASDGSIEAIPTGGAAPFTFTWIGSNGYGPVSGNPIQNLPGGEYSVLITDANGCSGFAGTYISEPGPFSITAIPGTVNGSEISCNGASDGSIDLIISGGAPPFSIAWTGPAGFTSTNSDLFDLAEGSYTVSVTDANDCTRSATVNLSAPDPLSVNLTPLNYGNGYNVTCADAADGEIVSSVGGGTSPYMYAWAGTGNFSSNSANPVNLSAGNYCLTVTDLNGCSIQECVSLTAPDPIQIVLDTIITPVCTGSVSAAIDVSIVAAPGPLTYAWTGPEGFTSASEDISGLVSGEYCLTVTDANGCSTQSCFNISSPQPLSASLNMSEYAGGYGISCMGSADGSGTIAGVGGTAPYSFLWTGPDGYSATGNHIEMLAAGIYCVEVTDAANCTLDTCITLTAPTALAANPDITLPTCAGSGSATIDLNMSGGVSPYTFNWNIPASTEFVEVGEGTYEVQVHDANGCSAIENFNIAFPDEIVVVPVSMTYSGGFNLKCNGDNNGEIQTTVFGGSLPYTYSWTGPNGFTGSTENLTGLAAGEYCITVTDNSGCTGDTCIVLSEPNPLTVGFSVTDASCAGGSDGSLSAAISGGIPTYSATWSGPGGFSGTGTELSGLSSGQYCVTVEDFSGCVLTECVEVNQPDPITINLSSPETDGFNIVCHGENTGSIISAIAGGTPPYAWEWIGPQGYASTDENPVNLYAGEYCLTLTDAAGCTVQECITLTEPAGVGIAITKFIFANGFNVSCADACDGSLSATLTGGIAPISIEWAGPNGFTSGQLDLNGLCWGTYTLTLTNGNGCTQDTSIAITRPAPISLNLNSPVFAGGNEIGCYGDASGSIQTVVTGGIPPYTYNWTGPDGFTDTSPNLTDLYAGNYQLTLTDASGCVRSANIELTQPDNELTVTATAFTYPSGDNISCPGLSNGSIDVAPTGGTAPYSFNWNGPDGFTSTDQNPTELSAGDYTLVVVDANTCVYTVNISLTEPTDTLDASLDVINDLLCHGEATGALEVSVSGGTPGYTIGWNGPNGFVSDAFVLDNLGGGTYHYTVEDINNCSVSGAYTLNELPEIIITGEVVNATCQTETGIVNITVANAAAPVSYSWNNGSQGQDLINVAPGIYTVEVTDANGCTSVNSFEVNSENSLEIEADVEAVSCYGSDDGMIAVNVISGVEPVTYDWTGPDGFTSGANPLPGLVPGNYTLTVTDANGCTLTEEFTIEQPDSLVITPLEAMVYPNGFNLTGFQTGDGVIYAPQVSGGSMPYSFIWSSENGFSSTSANNLLNLQAGTYVVVVTDANLCNDTATIDLFQPDILEMPNGISPNGDGFNDGLIIRGLDAYPENKLIVFNRWGNQVFEKTNYRNSDPWYGTNPDGKELPEGTYFVVVELSGADNLKGYLEIRR